VVAGAGACTQSPEARKQKAVDRAESYLKDGKANEAIIELRNALQIDKDYVPALRALGRAYASKFWHGDAARELARAQTLAPNDTDITIELARSQAELGLWKDVDEQSQRILAKSPKSAMGIYLRAIARLGQGKPEEALALADEAARGEGTLPPDLPPIRAEALVRLGKLPEAEQAYRASLAANPKDRRSLQGLGGLELRAGKFAEAKQHFSDALALAPQDPRVRLGLAAANAALGNVKEAIKTLEAVDPRARSVGRAGRARELLPSRQSPQRRHCRARAGGGGGAPVRGRAPPPRQRLPRGGIAPAGDRAPRGSAQAGPGRALRQFPLAQAYTRVGRPKDALALLDASAKRLDEAPSFHLERGRALALLGRLDEAYQAATRAQTLAPESAQPVLLMGQIRAQQGNTKAAQELFAKAAQMDQGAVPAHVMLGRLRASEQDLEGALAEFDTAVRADPKSVAAARTKAAALVQQKRTREAVQFLEGAVKAEPAVPGLVGLLAQAYATDNQLEKARSSFQKQLELDPKSIEARMGLARIALRQQKDDEAIGYLQAVVKANPDAHRGAAAPGWRRRAAGPLRSGDRPARDSREVEPESAEPGARPRQPPSADGRVRRHHRRHERDAAPIPGVQRRAGDARAGVSREARRPRQGSRT
jgi:tetratricopeptide (TPR) repeat protein